jgi:hypothetical protein
MYCHIVVLPLSVFYRSSIYSAYLIYPDLSMVHTDTDTNANNDEDTLKSFIIQTNRGCAMEAVKNK